MQLRTGNRAEQQGFRKYPIQQCWWPHMVFWIYLKKEVHFLLQDACDPVASIDAHNTEKQLETGWFPNVL